MPLYKKTDSSLPMDIPQIKKAPVEYDVAIVGSGAGGGMAAYTLAKAGAKVTLSALSAAWICFTAARNSASVQVSSMNWPP